MDGVIQVEGGLHGSHNTHVHKVAGNKLKLENPLCTILLPGVEFKEMRCSIERGKEY